MNTTVLIMAGGSGQRFWPLSTPERPKQLLKLFSDETMIRETVNRVSPLVPENRIFVATNVVQSKAIISELPMIPEENIIIEPAFKDTAAAIGYGCIYINQRYPGAQVIVLASDHLIQDEAGFRDVLSSAVREAKENATIVTLGIRPNKPETGYGYIETESIPKLGEIYSVKRFCEKPELSKAIAYLEQGNFLWNSGMFIFGIDTILEEFERHLPNHYKTLMEIQPVIESGLTGIDLMEKAKCYFDSFEKISIDYGIMEKSNRIKVISADFGWNDIGNYTALAEVFPKNENGTVIRTTTLEELDSKNNIIIGHNKHIALIGVEDMVVVQTDDTLLICRKDRVQDIKKLTSS